MGTLSADLSACGRLRLWAGPFAAGRRQPSAVTASTTCPIQSATARAFDPRPHNGLAGFPISLLAWLGDLGSLCGRGGGLDLSSIRAGGHAAWFDSKAAGWIQPDEPVVAAADLPAADSLPPALAIQLALD